MGGGPGRQGIGAPELFRREDGLKLKPADPPPLVLIAPELFRREDGLKHLAALFGPGQRYSS